MRLVGSASARGATPQSCRADGWMAVMTRPTACRHSSTTKLAISET